MESHSEFNFQYPQTLHDIWRITHRLEPIPLSEDSQPTIHTDAEYEKAYSQLLNDLTQICGSIRVIKSKKEAKEAANDYIAHLLSKEGPETFSSKSYLGNDCRKYLARKNNPVQYEMNEILREALHALANEGKIKCDFASKGKKYSNLTHFALSSCSKNESEVATRDNYLRNKHKVSSYTTTARAGNWENTRMITLENAKLLVLELLDAFGSWVTIEDLMYAMSKHIPEQRQIVSFETDNVTRNAIENIADDDYDDEEYMDKFHIHQINIKALQLSEILWERICAVNTQTFCLYYLPKKWFDKKKVTMDTLGASSTVGDQNDKLEKIFQKGLKRYLLENGNRLTNLILRKFPKIFLYRCTEIGYKPDLSTTVTNERS